MWIQRSRTIFIRTQKGPFLSYYIVQDNLYNSVYVSTSPFKIIHPMTLTFSILTSEMVRQRSPGQPLQQPVCIAKEFPPRLSESFPRRLVCMLVLTHRGLDLTAVHRRHQLQRANAHIRWWLVLWRGTPFAGKSSFSSKWWSRQMLNGF